MPDDEDEVSIVIGGGVVLEAYSNHDSAELHAKCVTGATAVGPLRVLDRVPDSIRRDVEVETFDDWDEEVTPVADPPGEVLGSTDGRSDPTADTIKAHRAVPRKTRPDR